MKLKRAQSGEGIARDERERIRQALFTRAREAGQAPISAAAFVTHEITTRLLELYARLRSKLDPRGLSRGEAMWVLSEHVFVPTACLILFQKQHLGLGTEFRGGHCWYLPEDHGKQPRKPVQRVLDCWLRVAGFRTAYGVSKEFGPDSLRRRIDRWLCGEVTPSVADLHSLVGKFADKVSWLDQANEWKGRFTLACAAQNVWDKADEFFKSVSSVPSLKLAQVFRDTSKKTVLQDDREVLVTSHTYFGARLLEMRLQQEGKLDKIFASVRHRYAKTFGPEVPDEKIREWRQRMDWEMKRGNWFADYLFRKARPAGRIASTPSLDDGFHLQEYIFNLGVTELNRMLAEKRKGPAGD